MAKVGLKRFVVIDGIRFMLNSRHKEKRNAKKRAAELRKDGWKARVLAVKVMNKTWYAVYKK